MGRLKVRAEEFHRLATVDPLTGLYNRRFAEIPIIRGSFPFATLRTSDDRGFF